MTLGLGYKPADLAADRDEGRVVQQGPGAVTGAVEDCGLGKRGEVGGRVELTGFNHPAGDEEVLGQGVDEGGDVEHELAVTGARSG